MLKKLVIAALKAKAIDLEAKAIKIWPRGTSWPGLVLRTTAALKAKAKAIDLEAKAIKVWP